MCQQQIRKETVLTSQSKHILEDISLAHTRRPDEQQIAFVNLDVRCIVLVVVEVCCEAGQGILILKWLGRRVLVSRKLVLGVGEIFNTVATERLALGSTVVLLTINGRLLNNGISNLLADEALATELLLSQPFLIFMVFLASQLLVVVEDNCGYGLLGAILADYVLVDPLLEVAGVELGDSIDIS